VSTKKFFTYSVEQQHLRHCQSRINGLVTSIKSGSPYQATLDYCIAARDDILTRISASDLAEMETYEGRVLTQYEKDEEAKAMAKEMNENRDRPSI
jgi:hypothetical protein